MDEMTKDFLKFVRLYLNEGFTAEELKIQYTRCGRFTKYEVKISENPLYNIRGRGILTLREKTPVEEKFTSLIEGIENGDVLLISLCWINSDREVLECSFEVLEKNNVQTM